MFDSIIKEVQEKFNLGDKAASLLSSLLGLIANPASGGFGGFIGRFKEAGLGDLVESWITTGDNTPISNNQLESALGKDTIKEVAEQAGIDKTKATSALGFMTPRVVDELTPDGEIPDEESLLSRVRGFLSDFGGAVGAAVLGGLGTAGAFASGAADRVDAAAESTVDAGKKVVGAVGDTAGAAYGKVSGALSNVGDALDGDSDGDSSSTLKWLIPLLLLGLLIVLSFWFCSKSTPTTTVTNVTNTGSNVNKAVSNSNIVAKTVDSSFSLVAKDGKYTVSGVVPDQKTLDEIKAKLTAELGEGIDFSGLKVEAGAKPFGTGWWDNFGKMLPSLKGWKDGSLAFAGSAITTAAGLPQAAIDQIKSLFGTGWTLPVSIAGAETATKQANEEALKELNEADSIDEVIKALNVSIINFKSGSSEIPADAKPILEKAAAVLSKQSEGTIIEIGGYTDNKGKSEENKKLSQSRADSVKKALVALGVKEAMLKAVGYGDADPVGDNNTEDGRFKNRRIAYKKADGTAPVSTTKTTTTTTNSSPANTNAAR